MKLWSWAKTLTDKLYITSLIIKGVDGVIEVIAGTLLLVLKPSFIHHTIFAFTTDELSQDPTDFFATHARHLATQITASAARSDAIFFLTHGGVKVALIIALLLRKAWAYPWALVIIGGLTVYQIYQMVLHYSLGLLTLTTLDIIVIILIWFEYQKVRHKAAAAKLDS